MSLAKLIQSKIDGTSTIEDLINKQLKKRDFYDIENVKVCANKLSDYLDKTPKESLDDDKINKFFFDLFHEMYANKPRMKGVLSPSQLRHECERKYYYYFTGEKETDEVTVSIDGRLQRIFDSGTWWHTYIQTILYRAGVLLESESKIRNRRKKLYGSTDGKIIFNKRKWVLEIKTMNSFSFAKGKIAVFDEHEYQATIYAKELDIDGICFIYINKDTSDLKIHFVDVKEKVKKAIDEKITFIHSAVKELEIPDRVCKSKMDKKACECPFRKLCFK